MVSNHCNVGGNDHYRIHPKEVTFLSSNVLLQISYFLMGAGGSRFESNNFQISVLARFLQSFAFLNLKD